MKGKISKIKNTKGELALPITTVEAVYLEDGKTKLSDEIKDVLKYEILDDEGITAEIPNVIEEIDGIKKDISEINSSLEQKTIEFNNKINIVAQTGTTVETIQNTVKHLNETGQIQGYALGKGTVKPNTTSFLTPIEFNVNFNSNLLNGITIYEKKKVGDSGELVDDYELLRLGYRTTSDFIPVMPNTIYVRTFINDDDYSTLYFYDTNKNFISKIYGDNSIILGEYKSMKSPINAYYVRFSSYTNYSDKIGLFEYQGSKFKLSNDITIDSDYEESIIKNAKEKIVDANYSIGDIVFDSTKWVDYRSIDVHTGVITEHYEQYQLGYRCITDYIKTDSKCYFKTLADKSDYNVLFGYTNDGVYVGKIQGSNITINDVVYTKFLIDDNVDKCIILSHSNVRSNVKLYSSVTDNYNLKHDITVTSENLDENLKSKFVRKIVFEDNFDELSLNKNNWRYELGEARRQQNAKQIYCKENVSIENNNLVITAKKENRAGFECTSGSITSSTLQEFKFGKIEARIKLPKHHGVWPAFWTLGSNLVVNFIEDSYREVLAGSWPICGEIDIMEFYNTASNYEMTIHHNNKIESQFARSEEVDVTQYNNYAIEWTYDTLTFLLNDKPQLVIDINQCTTETGYNPFRIPHYIILNLAITDISQISDDSKMYVDWVRIYEPLQTDNVPTTIIFDKYNLTLNVDETYYIEPKMYPLTANDCIVKWESTNESIATVYGGNVKAIGIGECEIMATLKNGVRQICKVIVT